MRAAYDGNSERNDEKRMKLSMGGAVWLDRFLHILPMQIGTGANHKLSLTTG